jgi:hypothetical protein
MGFKVTWICPLEFLFTGLRGVAIQQANEDMLIIDWTELDYRPDMCYERSTKRELG